MNSLPKLLFVKKKVHVTQQARTLLVISADLDMDQVLIIPCKCSFSFLSILPGQNGPQIKQNVVGGAGGGGSGGGELRQKLIFTEGQQGARAS